MVLHLTATGAQAVPLPTPQNGMMDGDRMYVDETSFLFMAKGAGANMVFRVPR